MNAGRRIGGAGSARGERDTRAARQLAIGIRHHGGAALMPRVDEAHALALVHAVERGQEAFAGHAEHGVGAVQGQLLDQNMATGSKICVHCLALPLWDYRFGPGLKKGVGTINRFSCAIRYSAGHFPSCCWSFGAIRASTPVTASQALMTAVQDSPSCPSSAACR